MRKDVPPKTRDWKRYNAALVNRGRLDIWISDDIQQSWSDDKYRGQGRPRLYSDACIETTLTFCALFGMALRMGQGFMESLFKISRVTSSRPSCRKNNRA